MRARILTLLLIAVVPVACGSPPKTAVESTAPSGGSAEWFTDQARQTGLDFVHFNGMSGQFYQPEIMAPGVALFDYDNDGDLDVYLVQGRMLGSGTPLIPPPAGELEGRLYRNDLQVRPDGSRVLHFTDVTAASGIHTRGYGMGVAAGDIDNDGWIDLYRHRLRRQPDVPQQRRRHVHRRVEGERHRRSGVVGRVGHLPRLRSRRLARSLRRQLPELQPRRPTSPASAHPARATTAGRASIARSRAGCIATAATDDSST